MIIHSNHLLLLASLAQSKANRKGLPCFRRASDGSLEERSLVDPVALQRDHLRGVELWPAVAIDGKISWMDTWEMSCL